MPATLHAYAHALLDAYSLFPGLTLSSPFTVQQVLDYISLKHQQGLSSGTIRSKRSALAFWHNFNDWSNVTDHFLVKKVLLGASNVCPTAPNSRIPMSPLLLHRVWGVLPSVLCKQYEVILYQAVFSLAFFACLRVGEYTSSFHVLCVSDILFISKAVKISFSSYKFLKNQVTAIILPESNSVVCPVKAACSFMAIRPQAPGILFTKEDGSPFSASDVRKPLKTLL